MYKIYRRDQHVVLEGPREGHEHLLQQPGVIMEDGITLCKLFPAERFKITPEEINAALAQHRTGRDVVLFSGLAAIACSMPRDVMRFIFASVSMRRPVSVCLGHQ